MKKVLLVTVLALSAAFSAEAKLRFISHRGESMYAPENTMAAFKLSIENGADGFELDTYMLKDGSLVCLHDRTPKRVGGFDVRPGEATLEQYRALDVGAWKGEKFKGEKIPTLQEALALVNDNIEIYVEVKSGVEAVPAIVKAVKAEPKANPKNIVFICFNGNVIKALREQMPEYRGYWLHGTGPNKKTGKPGPTAEYLVEGAKNYNASGLDLSYSSDITPEYIKVIRDAGLSVHLWTVNNPKDAMKIAQLDVDSLTSDRAAELKKMLGIALTRDMRPIGVFDSGIGGYTVLERLLAHPGLKGEKYVYLGDQANMPYGNYDAHGKAAYLRELSIKDALFLTSDGYYLDAKDSEPKGVKDPAKIVVIACNTATAYGREAADAVFKCAGARQRVIGVINAGVRSTFDKLKAEQATEPFAIGVMATPGTISSGAYQRTIRAEAAKRGIGITVDVCTQGCPGLADAIELGTSDADAIARSNLVSLVTKHRVSGATTPLKAVILGCTHYPFLMRTLEKTRAELGENFIFIDPAIDTAEECFQALRGAEMLAERAADGTTVDSYVSVPSADLPTACLAKDGTLATAYKYGREPDRDEVTTKFVTLKKGTVDRAALMRLVNLLPLTRGQLKKNGDL